MSTASVIAGVVGSVGSILAAIATTDFVSKRARLWLSIIGFILIVIAFIMFAWIMYGTWKLLAKKGIYVPDEGY
jgi:TRAP-type C4-dicarboxylate transport system permease small subunit